MVIDCRKKGVLWWGRSDTQYSRNSIIRKAFADIDVSVRDFRPVVSSLGSVQAKLSRLECTTAVWLPCFRQRDVQAARKWCDSKGIPLIFDPLISSYDKQVFERKKFAVDASSALKLLRYEQQIFQMADRVIADTQAHADFFIESLGVNSEKAFVIPVSAEEQYFFPQTSAERAGSSRLQVLFYGSFLELHGIDVIADAILLSKGLAIDWTLIGTGPMRHSFEAKVGSAVNLKLIDWVDYKELPTIIAAMDVVLGVFDSGNKASRVIPNKVYQAMACGKPVVTLRSQAYPKALLDRSDSGLYWVKPGKADEIIQALKALQQLGDDRLDNNARSTYDMYFSNRKVRTGLEQLLESLVPQTV